MKGKCETPIMTPSNVHILHPTPPPLAGYLHIGHIGHHKLEALHAADRLGFSRLVFDAAYAGGQADCLPDFGATRNDDFAKRFAEFAAGIGPSAVFAPVQAAEGDIWRSIDMRAGRP